MPRQNNDDPDPIETLRARSHGLGADPRVTNYGGGNTSTETQGVDPATSDAVATGI